MAKKTSLLQEAKNAQAFAKIGIYGFQGSGKTHTAMLIAQGIAQATGQDKIAFFDTETGSDWFANRMPKGMKLFVLKSSSYTDLMKVIRECEAANMPLVIDSVTHVWNDLIDSYMESAKKKKSKNPDVLIFSDWKVIKAAWKRYTRLFVNSKVHIIACGRAGNEYDMSGGDIKKTGTKMKAESEFNFEPHLVIEMEIEKLDGAINNIAVVRKDRSDTINGKWFRMPTFKNFKQHFDSLNIGGSHVGARDGDRDSDPFSDGSGADQVLEKMEEPPAPEEDERDEKPGDIV
jgi:hypothetical protein